LLYQQRRRARGSVRAAGDIKLNIEKIGKVEGPGIQRRRRNKPRMARISRILIRVIRVIRGSERWFEGRYIAVAETTEE
jgi:hypothetical protein